MLSNPLMLYFDMVTAAHSLRMSEQVSSCIYLPLSFLKRTSPKYVQVNVHISDDLNNKVIDVWSKPDDPYCEYYLDCWRDRFQALCYKHKYAYDIDFNVG